MILTRKCFLLALTLPQLYLLNAQPATPSFRASAGMVLVPITVTDQTGKTVLGLQKDDFTLLDERIPRQIVSFTGEDSPASVGLVFDLSGSMRDSLGGFKNIARAFLEASNPEDEFFLLTVSDRPAALSPFTTDAAELEKKISWAQAGGRTALLDTIYLGLHFMRGARRPRRAIFVLSDGMDNFSRYSNSELMRAAVEADTQIYSVVIDDVPAGKKPIERTDEQRARLFLDALAKNTGGVYYSVRSLAQAVEAARDAGRAIREEYVIGYLTPDSSASGKWRRIRVKAHVPNAMVTSRTGYYAR